MNEDDLINKLGQDLDNTKPPLSILTRYMLWVLICLSCLFAGIFSLGLREDWGSLFNEPYLLIQNIFILINILLCGFMAIAFSQPEKLKEKKGKKIINSFFILWTIILILIAFNKGTSIENLRKLGLSCIRDIIAMGIIPGLALYLFIRQGVVLKRFITTSLGLLATFGAGAWAVQFTCHNDDPIHVFLWHFAPVLVISGFGVFLGKYLFRKI